MIIDGYLLEFIRNGKGCALIGKQAKEIRQSLNNLNVLRSKMYFEALGCKFQICNIERHGSYKHVTFMRVR